jgi:hypothetical protein
VGSSIPHLIRFKILDSSLPAVLEDRLSGRLGISLAACHCVERYSSCLFLRYLVLRPTPRGVGGSAADIFSSYVGVFCNSLLDLNVAGY